jgi:hypothetical protein
MNTLPLLETEPLSPEAGHRIFTALAREMTLDAPAVNGGQLVEDATISYLQPDEPVRRNRRPLLLGLIAVAAAVLGAGIMIRDNSARTRTGTDVTPETMPIYLPTKLPDGFTFASASDSTSRARTPYRDQVYRDLSKPIGARVVQITTSLASVWSDQPLGHPMVILGRQAFDASAKDLLAIALTDGPVLIRIGGRGVSYAEIERIAGLARAASTDPTDGANVPPLPDGLKLVVDQRTMPPSRTIDASYSPNDDGTHSLNVTIWPTSLQDLDQWTLWNSYGTLTPTTVRGHDAMSFVETDQNMVGFVWPETKGTLITVSGRNVPAEQVRQAAEGLRRVSSNEWTELLKSKGIAIQDDGASGSPASAPPTTAATNASDRSIDPWNLPLLVPKDAPDLGKLAGGKDTTVDATFDSSPRYSRRQIYREAGAAPGSRAVQIEWSWAKPTAANPAVPAIEGQAPFTDEVPPGTQRANAIDPKGVFFRLSGRGLNQDELEAIAKSLTAPWQADRINVASLPAGFVEIESQDTAYEQYRSTRLEYGSVSVAMNPVGSSTIESYAIATPGSFAATKVRGHDGYVVTDPATNTLRLVWVESPGLLVEVKGIGTEVATLQRIAESLQPVSTDAWTKLLATVGAKPETVKAP